MAMIPRVNTRSPFFVQNVSSADAFCHIYIWFGSLSSVPATPTISLTKTATDGAATFEIGELMRDYIYQDSTYTSGTAWARVDTGDNVLVGGNLVVTDSDLLLINEGFELHSAGLQTAYNLDSSLALGINSLVTTLYIPEGETMKLPIYGNGRAGNVCTYQIWLDGVAGAIVPVAGSEFNNSQFTHINVPFNATQVQVVVGATTKTYTVSNGACSKYDAKKLTFVNAKGVKQDMYFNMKSSEKMSISSDTYSRSLIDYRNLSIGNELHQSKKRINNASINYVLNTDFVEEAYSDVMTELLLSEYVYLTQNGATTPVNVTDTSLERKTHLNDKLIQFTVNIEAGAQYINQIR